MMEPRRTATAAGLTVLTLIFSATGCGAGAKRPGEEESQVKVSETGAAASTLDPQAIAAASGAKVTTTDDGIVRIGWSRNDVSVTVDGMAMPPPAGLGSSWAAFAATADGAMVTGDNVLFRDEVDAAIDAAFAHGLEAVIARAGATIRHVCAWS